MENIIQIKIELDCNAQNAFRLFTVNELLEKWLTEEADVEPVVGGKYELFWEPENKNVNSTSGCKITGIERDTYVSFNWKGPAQFQSFMNSADPLTHVIVAFIPVNNNPNKTLIYLFHTGWRENQEWQPARDYFDNAWRKALAKLEEKVKNKSILVN